MHNLWTVLRTENEIDDFILSSKKKPVLFCKHSTRCSISSVALNRVEQGIEKLSEQFTLVYVDVIANRSESHALASKLDVQHESPQIIVLSDSKVIQVLNHFEITLAAINQN